MSSIAGLFQESPNGGKIPQTPPWRQKDWRDKQEYRTRINKSRIEAYFRIESFLSSSPVGHFLLLTLTRTRSFDLDVERYSEDWRRWYNAFLRKRFGNRYIRVLELQRSGRIHFHVLVDARTDAKSHWNTDKKQFIWTSENENRVAVRKLISDIRKSTKNDYGFGRIHVEPVIFTTSRTAAYLAKSVGEKVFFMKKPYRVRRTCFGKGVPAFKSGNFDPTNTYFRKGLVEWAKLEGFEEDDFDAIELRYGKGWRWVCMQDIMELGFKNLQSHHVTGLHSIGH